MKYFIVFFIFLFSCSRVEYIPIQSENKIEIRESIQWVIDTISIPLPTIQYINNYPILDTSYLESDVASSKAYFDTTSNKIYHDLRNKKSVQVKIDTFFKIKTIEIYKEKPVIKEIKVPEKYIPSIYKYSMCFSIIVILLIFIKLKSFLKI